MSNISKANEIESTNEEVRNYRVNFQWLQIIEQAMNELFYTKF